MITYILRFFPASGFRDRTTGDPGWRDSEGQYWSSSAGTTATAWRARFGSSDCDIIVADRTRGLSVRCVAQKEVSNYMLFWLFFFYHKLVVSSSLPGQARGTAACGGGVVVSPYNPA